MSAEVEVTWCNKNVIEISAFGIASLEGLWKLGFNFKFPGCDAYL